MLIAERFIQKPPELCGILMNGLIALELSCGRGSKLRFRIREEYDGNTP